MINSYADYNFIKTNYSKLFELGDKWAISLYESIKVTDDEINEFLKTTVNGELVEKMIDKKYPSVTFYKDDNDGYRLSIDNNFFEVLDIIDDLNKWGWFPATISTRDLYIKYDFNKLKDLLQNKFSSIVSIELRFEKKYDEKIIFDKAEKYLYHITPDVLYSKIEKFGLSPKGKGKIAFHPERVYLMRDCDQVDLINFAEILYQKMENWEKIKTLYVLKIKISDVKQFDFYKDPDFMIANGAVYTYRNISPSVIKVDRKINIV